MNQAFQSSDKTIMDIMKRKLVIELSCTLENTIFEVEIARKDISLEYIIKLVDFAPPKLQKAIIAKRDYIFYSN